MHSCWDKTGLWNYHDQLVELSRFPEDKEEISIYLSWDKDLVALPELYNSSTSIQIMIYSQTSLSQTCLSRKTAYVEVKFRSLFSHGNLRTGNKILWKRGEIAPKEQFLLFSTLFYIYISIFRSQITYSFVKCDCLIYCFPHIRNSDMLRYGYLEVFQRVPWNSR